MNHTERAKQGDAKQYPLIFSDEMVRAILDGRKTQTRRPATSARSSFHGQPGDLLWVRQTWQVFHPIGNVVWTGSMKIIPGVCTLEFRATNPSGWSGPWRSPRFMPRWASRIFLKISETRLEPLQTITETDCLAEGIETDADARYAFQSLWDRLYAKRGYAWHTNPMVWVITFRVSFLTSSTVFFSRRLGHCYANTIRGTVGRKP